MNIMIYFLYLASRQIRREIAPQFEYVKLLGGHSIAPKTTSANAASASP